MVRMIRESKRPLFYIGGGMVSSDSGGELNKNKPVTLPVCADLKLALKQMIERCEPIRRNPTSSM